MKVFTANTSFGLQVDVHAVILPASAEVSYVNDTLNHHKIRFADIYSLLIGDPIFPEHGKLIMQT